MNVYRTKHADISQVKNLEILAIFFAIYNKKFNIYREKLLYQFFSKNILKFKKLTLKYFHIKFCPIMFHQIAAL